MKQRGAIRSAMLVPVLGLLLGGCSVINTVADGVSSTVNGITDATRSTTSDDKSASFIENRFAAIRAEAARGGGENLDSLADLLGETDRADFARFMHARYAELFTGLAEPRELRTRIESYRTRDGAA
jgi:hypothetical protein